MACRAKATAGEMLSIGTQVFCVLQKKYGSFPLQETKDRMKQCRLFKHNPTKQQYLNSISKAYERFDG